MPPKKVAPVDQPKAALSLAKETGAPPKTAAAAKSRKAVATAAGARPPSRRKRPRRPDPPVVREVFTRLRAANPEPKGELIAPNPFTFLVSVVLSAQATDAGVNKATPALFALADTPAKMVALGEERVRDLVKTIGLFRGKARNIILLSEALLRDHGGQVPADRDALEKLAGVGRKTANVVMNTCFAAETIAVDTHVFRVSNRIPVALGETPLEVELGLERIVPAEFKRHAHHWLILHGRYVCQARKPLCETCVVSDLCTAPEKRV